jgi:two-component system response regulator RstA
MTRILLVEDDVKLARLIEEFLKRHGFEVAIEVRGDQAVYRIRQEQPDLVILDIMLPGMDGFEICKRIRTFYKNPVIMLTARGDEADELVGLEVGADDYMAKPVRPKLLLARIKTILRRSQRFEDTVSRIELGSIIIDAGRRSVHIDNHPVDLSTTEFDLIWMLSSHVGEIVTRDQISQNLRGYEWDGLDRSIDLSISRLRKKIGDDGRKPDRIRSIRGTGYMWVSE